MKRDRILAGDPTRLPNRRQAASVQPAKPLRIDADADQLDRGLARLVVAVLELVRQLLERQSVRRMEDGSLTGEEVERLGSALKMLQRRLAEVQDSLAIDEKEVQPAVDRIGDLLRDMDPSHPRRRS
jgi:hypothetical protein